MKIDAFAKDPLQQAVIAAMLEESNILQYAEFYSIIGNSAYTRKAASVSGGSFRGLNDAYTGVAGTPAYANPTLTIFGDEVLVDQAHERRGADVASVRSQQLLAFARSYGKRFQHYFVNGNSAAASKQFDGLKLLVPSGQTLEAADNGFSIPLGNSDANKKAQQEFLEMIDNLIAIVAGGAQLLLMPSRILSRLSRIAEGQVRWEKDEFGSPLAMYNGIPILSAGYNEAGGEIIAFTETQGTASDTASIYALRFGEAEKLTLATNIGVSVKDAGLVKNNYVHNVDFDLTMVLCDDKAVARLKGLKVA